MSKDVMQQALEAFEKIRLWQDWRVPLVESNIKALRAELAKPVAGDVAEQAAQILATVEAIQPVFDNGRLPFFDSDCDAVAKETRKKRIAAITAALQSREGMTLPEGWRITNEWECLNPSEGKTRGCTIMRGNYKDQHGYAAWNGFGADRNAAVLAAIANIKSAT